MTTTTSEDFDDIYGGRFVSSNDVKKPFTATIEYVEKEVFARPGEKEKTKAVLYLKGSKKAVVLNKTNALGLADAFGKDFESWTGQRVELRAERTTFGGKPTMGLRLYPVNSAASSTKAVASSKSKRTATEEDLDDELPEGLR